MHKITNRTSQPQDIHTRHGVKAIHAHGTLTAEFDPAYLEIIKLSFDVEKVGEKVELKDESVRVEELITGDPRGEYEALTGKKPDGRWSEERVLSELEELKA